MTISADLSITSLYAAVLGLMFVVFTYRVGAYRFKNRISLGDGNDKELLRRMRAQGNFVESVPLALVLIALMEFNGASNAWVHGVAISLVVGRLSHWLQLSGFVQPLPFRAGGMLLTLGSMATAAVWLLLASI